jgi:hypothetical protein
LPEGTVTDMTKLLIMLLAVAGIGIGAAPVASATDEMFWDRVQQTVDYPLTQDQAFTLGRVACKALMSGVNSGLSFGSARAEADQAVGQAQIDMGLSMSLPHGMFLVEAAEAEIC